MHTAHTAVLSLCFCVAAWSVCFFSDRILRRSERGTLNEFGLTLACQISFGLGSLLFIVAISFGFSFLMEPK